MPLVKKILYVCISTLVIVYCCIEIQKAFFPTDLFQQFYSTKTLVTHYLSCLLISLIISIFFRNISIFIILQMAFIGALYLANLYKIIHLLFPIYPTDAQVFLPFIIILPTSTKLILLASSILTLILIIFAASRKLTNYAYGICLVIILSLGLNYYSKEVLYYTGKYWISEESDKVGSYLDQGPVFYLSTELLRQNKESITYSQIEVQHAISEMFSQNSTSNKPKIRNIYLIVVESLVDPSLLKTVKFDNDPFDSRFRKLWQQSNNSTSLSPVFGGSTSQAEFEILCGYPLLEKQIIFYKNINKNNLCLPQILKSIGYHTTSMHPFKGGYWNRNYAYKNIGIEEFLDTEKFSKHDLNGLFMSDNSFLLQATDYIRNNHETRPNFYYLLTSSSHYPYTLNNNYTKHIKTSSSKIKHDDLKNLENYSNSIFYTTKAVMDFVDNVRIHDPNSIMVIVGDHPPSLSNDFNQLFVNNYKVPLIIIDGKNGPLKLGTTAHFEIPKIIMKLLGVKNSIYSYEFALPLVRPLPMQDAVVLPTLHKTCYKNSQEPICKTIANQLLAVQTIYTDSLFGNHYSQTMISGGDGGWTRN